MIDEYMRGTKIPCFKPDICLTSYGRLKIKEAEKTVKQIWVKTNNKNLIMFIMDYDWEGKLRRELICQPSSNKFNLGMWKFKKILLEEFYGVKNGE
jgi:hypothetical protein